MTYRPNGTWKRTHSRQQPFPGLFWRTREAPAISFAFLETPALTRTKPERPSYPTRIFVSRLHNFDDFWNSHLECCPTGSDPDTEGFTVVISRGILPWYGGGEGRSLDTEGGVVMVVVDGRLFKLNESNEEQNFKFRFNCYLVCVTELCITT